MTKNGYDDNEAILIATSIYRHGLTVKDAEYIYRDIINSRDWRYSEVQSLLNYVKRYSNEMSDM